MMINGFGHAAFRCRDLETSVAFYRDKLGMKEKFRLYYGEFIDFMRREKEEKGKKIDEEYIAKIEPLRDRTWIVYMEIGDGTFIELFDQEEASVLSLSDGHKFNYLHLALVVDDIHELKDKLAAAGVHIDRGPDFGMEGTWQLWTRDPDGNQIEWMQYTDASMQLTGRLNK